MLSGPASALGEKPTPVLRLADRPAINAVIGSSTPVFRWSWSGSAIDFLCRIDQEEPFTCESPFRTPGLRDGPHRFEVSAVDPEGTGLTTAGRRFRVDTRPPGTGIRKTPPALTKTIRRRTRVTLRFRGRGGARRFECRLGNAAWRRCRSPFRRRVGPGRYRFAVRAIDRADGGHGGVVSHQMLLLKRGDWKIGVAIVTQGNPTVEYGNQTLLGVARRLLRGLPH